MRRTLSMLAQDKREKRVRVCLFNYLSILSHSLARIIGNLLNIQHAFIEED